MNYDLLKSVYLLIFYLPIENNIIDKLYEIDFEYQTKFGSAWLKGL